MKNPNASAVAEINRLAGASAASIRKTANTTTATKYSYPVRLRGGHEITTDLAGIGQIKKAIEAGDRSVEVDRTAEGATTVLACTEVVSVGSMKPTTPQASTIGTPMGATERCTQEVRLADGGSITTDPESVSAIIRAMRKGDALVDALIPSGFVRTLAVAHISCVASAH